MARGHHSKNHKRRAYHLTRAVGWGPGRFARPKSKAGADGRSRRAMMNAMRFWLGFAFAHLMFVVSILWNIQHVAKVYKYGWFATMGLSGTSTPHIVVTFVGLGVVYVVQLALLLGLVRLWRHRFRRLASN